MGPRRYASAALARLRRTPPTPGTEPSTWVETAPSPGDVGPRGEGRGAAGGAVCGWTGSAFEGPAHCEFAVCPRCGSIARDRFLFWCFVTRTPPSLRARLLETRPRMGDHSRV